MPRFLRNVFIGLSGAESRGIDATEQATFSSTFELPSDYSSTIPRILVTNTRES